MGKEPVLYSSYKKWIIEIFCKYKLRIIVSALIVIFRGIILLLPPLITQKIIDEILPNGSFQKLTIYTIVLIVIPLVVSVLIITDLLIDKYILKIMSKVRCDIYKGIQSKPLKWFHKTQTGDLISRMLDETEDLANFAYFGVGSVIWFNVTIVVGLSLLLTRSLKITVLLLVFIICQAYIVDYFGKLHKKNSMEIMGNRACVTDRIIESVSGIQFIKTVAGEKKEEKKISVLLEQQRKLLKKQSKLELYRDLVKILFIVGANMVIYFYGGVLVLEKQLTIGTLIAINSLYTWVEPAIFGYQDMYIGAKKILPSLERVCEIMYTLTIKSGCICPSVNWDLELSGISFEYDDQEKVIKNLSCKVKQGISAAVIGSSGSGKSTLAYLILGLLEPNQGEIKIGGCDINSIDRQWLRNNVLCVSQETQLRPTSILDNILYFKRDVSNNQIWEVLKIVCLDQWIKRLPNGLDTFIGEQGLMISGGEKQRICIARAILRKPKILILDEATSALDCLTEKCLMGNLKKFLPDTTILYITHRTEIISYAEQVIQMNK